MAIITAIIRHEYYQLNGIWMRGSNVLEDQSYFFDDTDWKDKLSRYHCKTDNKTYTLTYDAIGNPLNYRSNMTMQWQNGRELKTLTRTNSASDIDEWSYQYDANGQRMQKVQKHATSASGTRTTRSTTKYYYDGTKLAVEKKDGTIVWYDYDKNGAPIGMRVNGEDYLYRKNLQGDITGLYNSIQIK